MKKTPSPIGQVIRAFREDARISQEELGDRAGIHRTYVSQLERGVKSPTLAILQRIAFALDIKASEIVQKTEEA